jgi:ribonuclease D
VEKTYLNNISHEDIRELELKAFSGRIILVDRIETFREAFSILADCKVIGFDTETKPSFKKGRKNKVSLIQLSDGNNALLLRINRIGIPDELIALFSDPAVKKIGVALHDDIKMLSAVRRFSPQGFIDLQKMVKEYGIESSGLKKLVAIILGFRISKSQQVTDWEADHLSDAQQVYAATDAWVCHEIYRKLIRETLK